MIIKKTRKEPLETDNAFTASTNIDASLLTEDKEYEVCVLCGRVTQVSLDTPIDERRHYIEGGGQLCTECYKEAYQTK